jgi:hypothetical protein
MGRALNTEPPGRAVARDALTRPHSHDDASPSWVLAVSTVERLFNMATLMGLGFLALTFTAYLDHDYPLASFYLLMAGGLLLGQAAHLASRNKPVRLAADLGIGLLAVNALAHYNYRLDNSYGVMSLVFLAAAIAEAVYVARRL